MKKIIYTASILQVLLACTAAFSQNVTTVELFDARTTYDLQSNSSAHLLEQNPSNPLHLHAAFTVSAEAPPLWADRNVRYFFSDNGGSSWDYLGLLTATRSGFASLGVTNDDRAVIAAHCTDGGGIQRIQLYVDLAPGVGSWTRLDPGVNGSSSFAPIWPVIFVNPANNHVVFAGSYNGLDSSFVNVCTNITGTGTFTGYRPLTNGETAGQYATAAGTGIIGAAYNTLDCGAAYIFSTNNGITWSTPAVFWTWNPADSIGTLRSIDMRYQGSTPQVVLGLCKVDPNQGGFWPGSPSKIVFWSPAINGGNPVKIDSAGGLTGTNPQNDVHLSVCRPVIGGSASGSFLYAAYSRARTDTSALGNNFFDIYVSCSQNGGANWSAPFKVTNISGPLNDCRYPSISNINGLFSNQQAVNLLYQKDSIAGSAVSGAPLSWAKMMYARVTNLSCTPVSGISQSGGIPARYVLKQNYPNPFNPITQIEFALPVESHVKIVIYNSLGEAVDVIVDQTLRAGSYKADWNASLHASGVYFYEMVSGKYKETRKMVLLK